MQKPSRIKIFKNAWFQRFAEKRDISDALLKKAVSEVEDGLIDADLGGNVIKQRIPQKGQGKSGGFRTIIFFRKGEKAFFVYGFSKNERENIDSDELKAFKQLAKELLALSDEQLQKLTDNETLIEVT